MTAEGVRLAADAVVLATGISPPGGGPLGLGLRTDPGGALIDRHGHASGTVFTLGALRRETTAVPEIRAQASALAARIASRAA